MWNVTVQIVSTRIYASDTGAGTMYGLKLMNAMSTSLGSSALSGNETR